jgi:hypothetical protein
VTRRNPRSECEKFGFGPQFIGSLLDGCRRSVRIQHALSRIKCFSVCGKAKIYARQFQLNLQILQSFQRGSLRAVVSSCTPIPLAPTIRTRCELCLHNLALPTANFLKASRLTWLIGRPRFCESELRAIQHPIHYAYLFGFTYHWSRDVFGRSLRDAVHRFVSQFTTS